MPSDIEEINARLIRIEEQVKGLDRHLAASGALATAIADLTSRVIHLEATGHDHERRIGSQEADKSRLVWMVLGAVAAALLSLVVGVQAGGGLP